MAVWYPVESWKASGELDRLRGVFNAGIENDLGHPNNVVRQSALAHRILCDELQKCRIPKIVPAFEGDVLMHKVGMLMQVGTHPSHVTCIEEVHGATKCSVFNALMMRQIQLIRERWFFNMRFQSRPTRKSI